MRKNIVVTMCILLWGASFPAMSQPNARRTKQETKPDVPELSVRAQSKYPRSRAVPEDVIWMREIYRTIDVNKGSNGALYHPVEPLGEQVNLFTLVFRLLAEKKIPAYEYMLDGIERFAPSHQVNFKEVLDRFQVYYEQRASGNRRDSVFVVENNDIPSADIMTYFIKEVWYFDQHTSTYGSVVTALCPVMHRSEEFTSEVMKLPMFWIEYKDLAPYLIRVNRMTSDLNNSANRTLDDFFAARLYQGDIYKTSNMLNRTLSQYCETDSALVKEQKRIEAELKAFEDHLYGNDLNHRKDSIPVGDKDADKGKSSKEKVSKNDSSKESLTPKATVRRQRR